MQRPWIKIYDLTISTNYLENRTMSHAITVNGKLKFTYLGSTPSAQCTLMMRSLPELEKPLWHLEDFVQMSGSEMESSLTPS